MEIIKNTGNYIVFGKDAEPDEGIWTNYKAETDRKIREYIDDLNSSESDPAGGLPRRPCEKRFETFLLTGNAGKKGSARRASDRVLN